MALAFSFLKILDYKQSILETLKQMWRLTGDPCGHVDGSTTAWTISYLGANRILFVTPNSSQNLYVNGRRFTKTVQESHIHSTSLGLHYYFRSSTGALGSMTTPWTIVETDMIPVAVVYYDPAMSPVGYALRETHLASRNRYTHQELHRTIGTYQKPVSAGGAAGGLIAGTFTVYAPASSGTNPTLDSIAPRAAAITLMDEELETPLSAMVADGPYMRFYKLWTTNKWGWSESATAPYWHTANVPSFNPSSGGDSLVALANNDYICCYLVRMPVADDVDSQRFRNIWIMGQTKYTPTANNDTARDAARNLALAEDHRASLDLEGLPSEWFVDAKLVLRYNTAYTNNDFRLRIAGYQKLTGSRNQAVAVAPGAITSLNDTNVNITSAAAGNLNPATETTQKLVNERVTRFGYIADWVSGASYRVGNIVWAQNSSSSSPGIYRCITANSDAAFTDSKWFGITEIVDINPTPVAADGTIAGVANQAARTILIVGQGGVPRNASLTPFGDVSSYFGGRVTLIGNSNNAPVTIRNNPTANGTFLNGDCTLGSGDVLDLVYSPGFLAFVEISRSINNK